MAARPFDHISVLPMTVKEVNRAERTFWLTASTPKQDRDREVVSNEAMAESRDRYMANPVITWQHDTGEPIGKALDARVTDYETDLFVYITDKTPAAQKAFGLIEDEIVKSASIGFSGFSKLNGPHPDGSPDFELDETGTRTWKRIEWLETAIVTIPSNDESVIHAFAKSLGLEVEANPTEHIWRASRPGVFKV